MRCIYCTCEEVNEDALVIDTKEWPIYICPDCEMIWSRPEDKK